MNGVRVPPSAIELGLFAARCWLYSQDPDLTTWQVKALRAREQRYRDLQMLEIVDNDGPVRVTAARLVAAMRERTL